MAILKLNNNSLSSVTELPSGVGSDPNTKVSLARLGLRVFANQNLATSNTQNLSYDVFQDSSGVQNLTNVLRDEAEFMSSVAVSTSTITMDNSNYTQYIDTTADGSAVFTRYGTGATSNTARFNTDGSNTAVFSSSSSLNAGNTISVSNEATMLSYMFGSPSSDTAYLIDNTHTSQGIRLVEMVWRYKTGVTFRPNGTIGFRWRNGSGNFAYWELRGINHATNSPINGQAQWHDNQIVQRSSAVTNGNSYTLTASQNLFYQVNAIGNYHTGNNSFMWDTLSMQGDVNAPQTNATGTFEGVDVTAPSSVSKMGAVITYQETGTNVLNTDIVMKLSADSGSNFTTATLEALPDFASGVKCAKISDVSVTPGTACTYQINFANQVASSKVAQITGVALTF